MTGEDKTCPLCQGLALRESCRRRRLRGFVPEAHLSTIITLTKHKVAEEMFSFARQKRTRKAPATFDAREARPGFHPGPKSGGRRNKIGRCACGTDAFSNFSPAPILKGAYRKRQQGGEKPSPSRLRRATSPERERLWQRRKVYRLSADFFLPVTGKDETHPLCQGLHLRERLPPAGGRCRRQATKRGTSCRAQRD